MSRGLDLGPARRPRRPSLTPLVDVVFLLLVFFMLAARFGAETALPLAPASGEAAPWEGPPRLIDLTAAGPRLNGVPTPPEALAAALAPLMPAPDSPVILRAGPEADVAALAEVLGRLRAAGHKRVAVME